jgi:UPF0716 protein FxsA
LFKLLFLLFLIVPAVEIYLLIEVGSRIGAASTILLIILTAMLGAFLLRIQGIMTIARVQQSLDQGKLPATELVGGLMLLLTGALLLTPGFFTDAVGFICLIPNIRNRVANSLLKSFFQTHVQKQKSSPVTLEGEYWEE